MPISINGKQYLSVSEIADTIDITRQTLWRWRRDGFIPQGSKYRGRQIVYTPEEVEIIRQFSERLVPLGKRHRHQKTLFERRR